MAFIVENGTGLDDATSYIDEAFADAYFVDRGNTTWDGADSAAKQIALIQASQYVDIRFIKRYKGIRINSTQSLGWPRLNVVDNEGYTVVADEVPRAIENAVAEYAVRAISQLLLKDPVVDDTGMTVERLKEKVGPIETDVSYRAGGTVTGIQPYPTADRLVTTSGLLIASGGRLVRS